MSTLLILLAIALKSSLSLRSSQDLLTFLQWWFIKTYD